MGYVFLNLNPRNNRVGDCVIRALAKAMGMTWDDVAIDLSMMMVTHKDMPSSNALWGEYLSLNGFRRGILPTDCPNCFTIHDFCNMYPAGTFVVGTGSHVVAVIDGNYFDTFDSGNELVAFYYEKMR